MVLLEPGLPFAGGREGERVAVFGHAASVAGARFAARRGVSRERALRHGD